MGRFDTRYELCCLKLRSDAYPDSNTMTVRRWANVDDSFALYRLTILDTHILILLMGPRLASIGNKPIICYVVPCLFLQHLANIIPMVQQIPDSLSTGAKRC